MLKPQESNQDGVDCMSDDWDFYACRVDRANVSGSRFRNRSSATAKSSFVVIITTRFPRYPNYPRTSLPNR
jgi:hypothetical protein